MNYTKQFKKLIQRYKEIEIEYPNLKAISLAMWILESGRGSSDLAKEHNNFAGMKYREALKGIAKKVSYQAHDGADYYCGFEKLEDFIKGFWLFLDRSPYKGWRKLAHKPKKFIQFIGPIWAEDKKYAKKVISLQKEAKEILQNAPVIPTSEYLSSLSKTYLSESRPSIIISEDGKIASGKDGLDIDYKGSDSCPYGKTASKNKKTFEGIILHHNNPKHSTEWLIDYQLNGDPERGGHFGYHFYISPEGKIYQGAPLTKRTNQAKSIKQRREIGKHLKNVNTIGITNARAAVFTGAGKVTGSEPTKAQIDMTKKLVVALVDYFELSFDNIYGHGEVQKDRHHTEGTEIAKDLRSWNDHLNLP